MDGGNMFAGVGNVVDLVWFDWYTQLIWKCEQVFKTQYGSFLNVIMIMLAESTTIIAHWPMPLSLNLRPNLHIWTAMHILTVFFFERVSASASRVRMT